MTNVSVFDKRRNKVELMREKERQIDRASERAIEVKKVRRPNPNVPHHSCNGVISFTTVHEAVAQAVDWHFGDVFRCP